jgi:hypothetical protein
MEAPSHTKLTSLSFVTRFAATFMHEATEFFLHENLPRFITGADLLNPVDPNLGY